jgi:DNA modification methylase
MNIDLRIGDCLKVMPTMPENSVDAIVTDPPFGINFKYDGYSDNPEGYGLWLWNCISLAESKCRPGSPVFVWQAMPNVRKFVEWFPRDWRLFAACKNWVQIRQCAMNYSYDPIVVWWTPGAKPYSEDTLSRDYFIANTSPSAHTGLNKVKGHPCPRPLDLMEDIVNQWTKPNSIVFDPFMGSGTTGVACVKMGRNFIGIEIEQKYFEIAKKRIEEAQMQQRLEL